MAQGGGGLVGLRVVPVSSAEARAYTEMWHRHHAHVLPAGHKFAAGVADDDDVLRGVALTGRPAGRGNQDGSTVEVTRCTTDGTRNACTMLYGASARMAKAQGWRRIITYTQEGESGASLRAAGFVLVAEREPRTDHFESSQRYREDHGQGGVRRYLWERVLNPAARPWKVPSRPAEAVHREMPHMLWEIAPSEKGRVTSWG
jgi:hypothetical protein